MYHMKSPWTDLWTIFGFEFQTRLKLLTALTAQLPVGVGLGCIWKGRESAELPRVLHVIALACSREVHIRKDRDYSGRSVRLELCCFIYFESAGWPGVLHVIALACSREVDIRKDSRQSKTRLL